MVGVSGGGVLSHPCQGTTDSALWVATAETVDSKVKESAKRVVWNQFKKADSRVQDGQDRKEDPGP
jgi:hypothetical protein